MTRLIISEEEAERLGEEITGKARDRGFTVFLYRKSPENLTLFGVEIKATREIITTAERKQP
jgi:hypothetical protein